MRYKLHETSTKIKGTPVEQSLEYFILLSETKPVICAINRLALIFQVRADLVWRFRILQDIPEDCHVTGRNDNDSGDPRTRYQFRFHIVAVIEQFPYTIVSQEVSREEQSLHVAVRRKADADYEGATIIIKFIVPDSNVRWQNIEFLVQRILYQYTTAGLFPEVIVLDCPHQIESGTQFNTKLCILYEGIVANL